MYNGVEFTQQYLSCLILAFLILDLDSESFFFLFKLYVGSYMFSKALIGLLQTSYDTLCCMLDSSILV
jgi:hypothetical protein